MPAVVQCPWPGRRTARGGDVNVTTDTAGGPSNGGAIRSHVVRQIVADPTRSGVLYAAEPVEVTGPDGGVLDYSDVFFARSTDYGVTWSTQNLKIGPQPVQVLNDENGGHKATGRPDDVAANQAAVRLSIDGQGNLALVWYDPRRRNSSTPTSFRSTTSAWTRTAGRST